MILSSKNNNETIYNKHISDKTTVHKIRKSIKIKSYHLKNRF